jgi:dipeptidyl aminopeptidase/acylaminoacyl peptidase
MKWIPSAWLTLALAPSLLTLAQSQPAKAPFTAKDWAALRSASTAAVASDGTILYQVTFGADHGPTQKEWWTIDPAGSHAVKLDLPNDFTPLGFTRDAHGLYGSYSVNQIHQLAIFALEKTKAAAVPSTVVLLPRGMQAARPSPDGKRFAVIADPRPPDPLDETRRVQEADQSSIYVVNSDGTAGQWWCPNLKFVSASAIGGGSETPVWNVTGDELAVLSQLPRIGHHNVSGSIDVCTQTGARHVVDIPDAVSGIAWADGGRSLAFLSTKSEVLTPEHVWTAPASGGPAKDCTPDLNGTAVQLAGSAQGRVWVVVNRGVKNEVDSFQDGALKLAYAWTDGIVAGTPVTPEYADGGDQAALTVGDPIHSRNVAVPDGDHLRRITHESDPQLANVELGPVRAVQWKSKQGIALEGIATFPAGYVEGKEYPFLVLPHGGPEANDELGFDSLARIIAGLGYVVLQPEYRGSTGYGADFLAAIYQHFGDRAYSDVDSATDFAVAQGWADPAHLAIFGWSAGGFMTSWTVTQTSRYKAAIEGAGITDWGPFLWTSDIQQIDYDARWTDEDPEAFRQFSAVAFADKVTTPLLILHGEADQRVPTFQGTEFFQLLAARGKTVRMVTYPGSPHFPVLWEQRLNVVQELTDWLSRYNK